MLGYVEEPEWTKNIVSVLQKTTKNIVSLLSILHILFPSNILLLLLECRPSAYL